MEKLNAARVFLDKYLVFVSFKQKVQPVCNRKTLVRFFIAMLRPNPPFGC
jgi:hypothetical protein